MNLPVRQVNRPAALDGQQNGRIAPDRMLSVETNGTVATLVRPAAHAWAALVAAAERDGHTLVPFSTYRSYDRQKALFLARYSTTYKANVDRKIWEGKTWYKHTGATTAAPGTSNHGWGLAVDVRVKRGGVERPIDDPAVAWLVANEHRFGFSHEIQSEPWHIRYWAGDNSPIKTPIPAIPEDDMTPAESKQLAEVHRALVGADSAMKEVLDAARLNGPTHARILAQIATEGAADVDEAELARAFVAVATPVMKDALKAALREGTG
jgi:LAS superfamily LD-carboxypeptidase LdcB